MDEVKWTVTSEGVSHWVTEGPQSGRRTPFLPPIPFHQLELEGLSDLQTFSLLPNILHPSNVPFSSFSVLTLLDISVFYVSPSQPFSFTLTQDLTVGTSLPLERRSELLLPSYPSNPVRPDPKMVFPRLLSLHTSLIYRVIDILTEGNKEERGSQGRTGDLDTSSATSLRHWTRNASRWGNQSPSRTIDWSVESGKSRKSSTESTLLSKRGRHLDPLF